MLCIRRAGGLQHGCQAGLSRLLMRLALACKPPPCASPVPGLCSAAEARAWLPMHHHGAWTPTAQGAVTRVQPSASTCLAHVSCMFSVPYCVLTSGHGQNSCHRLVCIFVLHTFVSRFSSLSFPARSCLPVLSYTPPQNQNSLRKVRHPSALSQSVMPCAASCMTQHGLDAAPQGVIQSIHLGA